MGKKLWLFLFPFALIACEDLSDLPPATATGEWTLYSKNNGLVSNNFWCIETDSHGNIWAGSNDRGVLKFDGTDWQVLGTEHGLIDYTVLSAEEDVNGDMWFGTMNGFSIYDGSKFSNFYGPDSLVLTVTALKSDQEGDMWLGTFQHGLYEITSSGINHYHYQGYPERDFIHAIDVDAQGNVWAGSDGGVYKISGNRVDFYTSEDGLSSDVVRAVFVDSWGQVWLGTWQEDFITRYANGSFEQVSLFNSSSPVNVNAVSEDSRGNLWFALVLDGAVRYDGASMRSFTEKDGLPRKTIIDITTDQDGNIWFASFENGISKFTPPFEKF